MLLYTNYSYNYNYTTLHYTTPDYNTIDYTAAHNAAAHHTTIDYATEHNATARYSTLHYITDYITLHYIKLHYTTLITPHHNYNCNYNCATLIALYTATTPLHYNYNYSCTTAHYIQQLWLQPLQPPQKTQLQPPFGPSADLLCNPCITTTHLSYSILSLKLLPPPWAVLPVSQWYPICFLGCKSVTLQIVPTNLVIDQWEVMVFSWFLEPTFLWW